MDVHTPEIRSVREQIADTLRAEVLSNGLSADEPLREVELAQRFGVGRGPIRDALLQLTHEGALVYHPNRGVRVGSPANEATRKLLVDLRRKIETHALASLFDDLSDADDDRWQEMLDELEHACRKGQFAAVVAHDMAFHRSLIQRAASSELHAVWLPITVRMRLVYSRHDDLLEVHQEHQRITDAIVARDKRAALALLKSHIC